MEKVRVSAILVWFLAVYSCCAFGAAPLRLFRKKSIQSSVQGILQIYYNGTWGTICDDNWDSTDTYIACKQLGYVRAVSFKYLRRGSGPIWLSNVYCDGDELSLDQCHHRGWGVHSCSHSEDVGIVCNSAPLRLFQNKSTPLSVQGILQIYYNGTWGTICDDYWDMTDTNIACKQLGYVSAARYKHLGQVSGPIWLDNVDCNGDESTLDQCHHRGWGVHNCGHSEDVGIVCNTGAAPLRLFKKKSTPSSVQGILQIYHNGRWGTICDDLWDMTDTNIACKQLGLKDAVRFKYLGQVSGPIWLDNVNCNSGESSLDQCKHRGWGVHNCSHSQDVGIVCNSGIPPPLRLFQNKSSSPQSVQGILQIYYNGTWGTICDDYWNITDTKIACKQLGYNYTTRASLELGRGSGPIWLYDVDCNGDESSLNQCQHRGWGLHGCTARRSVGIECNSAPPLRLLHKSPSPSLVQGILQIYYNGTWGTICGSWRHDSNTNIACKQLGYESAASFRHLGRGPDPIWLSNVYCDGNELSLDQCQHRGWGKPSCSHNRDVGIVCYTGPPVKVRLIGDVPNAGRVQLLYKGVWKNLCDSDWYSHPAKVICRMAGYPDGVAVSFRRYEGSGEVWLSSSSCNSYEQSIETCRNLNWGQATCLDNKLAGVVCKSGSPKVAFRLVNGPVPHAGRLEMRYYGLWRPVFLRKYIFWQELRLTDVHTVCRMMGYNHTITFNTFKDGRTSYRVGIHCQGFEKRTEQCRWFNVDYDDYYQGQNTWIVCQPYAGSRFSVRLMDDGSLNKGRVEIGYSGAWGTVSDRHKRWNLTAANIVCRMLGYRNASWTGRAKVLGNGFIMTAYKHCTGNETSLEYCEYYLNTYFDAPRNHSYDVGVRCVSDQEPVTLQIRLEKGTTSHSGRVGVRYGNSWSTLCYEGLDYPDVKVICRMLGYVSVDHVYAVRTPSSANGRVWLSGVECNGTEASILNCNRTGWWQTTCDFDAVITCKTQGKTAVDIRLETGTTPHSGRVGIRYGNKWGTLCNKELDTNDVKVICRMLGYVGVSHVFTIPGNGTIWLSDLECNGEEDSIVDCSHSGWWQTSNCTHDQDAAVTCKLADAPHFQISSSNDITDSAVIINLAKAATPLDARLKSSYQFMVEKGREIPSPITSHSNKSTETCSTITKTVFSDSYIAAEVSASPNDATSFTIGDGLYYHGYHNVPLEPGCVYRVHVRIVTMAMDGKKIFGKSSFVRFATTSVPVENPPEFQISDSRSIRQKSAKITFLRKQQRKAKVYKRLYQVVVERTGIDVFLSTKDMRVNHSYIAAEIPTTSSTFTIGDGLNYHGYNNTPLEPGCNYKVYVRVVTMTSNEKKIFGKSSFVRFATTSFSAENAPEFQISDSRSIQQKSAKITFLRKKQRKPISHNRWYQVTVDKTDEEVFTSKDMGVNHSYIAAEIPTNSSTFTIGDGLNYHGYNNTPLEPGCNYRVYVRVVTMTSNEKRVISDAPFVSFTTKSGAHGYTQGHSDKNSNDPLVIGLAVLLVMSIVALIGHIVYHVTKRRKKERKRDDNPQIEISDLAAAHANTRETSDQQNRSYPSKQSKTNAVSLAGNDSHYQSLVPQNRSRGGFGEESTYQISNVIVRPGKSTLSHMEEPIYERPN